MADLHFLANPARFRRFSQRVLPGLAFATVLGLAVGLYLALLQSPPDYQQGETVRIMFVHVPAAWLSMAGYALLAVLGASLLVWRHPLAALMARATAPGLPRHGLAVGPADVGHLLGVGRETHLDAAVVLPLSRPHRLEPCLR
jgi:hypothetical protein